jgi:NADPH-dependent curcumin reductase CurA
LLKCLLKVLRSIIIMSNDWSPVDLNTEIRLGKVPDLNYPKVNDIFQMMVTPPVPTDNVQKGQVVVRNLYLSIDAAMRVWISGKKTYMDPVVPGDVMRAMGVGVIIFSNGNLKAGDIVMGMLEWQKFCLIKEKELIVLPKDYPNPQHFLGVYGISGLTAYFGLFEVGKIKAGDIVVVSAAAGAVGELAIQLAKNAGCTVIGVAGGQDKCDYVKSIGADAVIDYKQGKFLDSLRKACQRELTCILTMLVGRCLMMFLWLFGTTAELFFVELSAPITMIPRTHTGSKTTKDSLSSEERCRVIFISTIRRSSIRRLLK